VITDIILCFERKRVFTFMKINVSALTVLAFMVAFFLSQLPALFIKVVAVRPSTWAIIEEAEFEDVFANLALSRAPFNVPTLTEEVRQLMETIVGKRSSLRKAGLEVVRLLERILTIPSDILMMFDESYYHYLVLTNQITFNVRNFLFSPFNLFL
jgi:hypothetical protein